MVLFPADPVLQGRTFQNQHPSCYHSYAGYVYTEQLYFFKTTPNLQHQVYGYLDFVRIVHSLSHPCSLGYHWTSSRENKRCVYRRFQSTNTKNQSTKNNNNLKRNCKNICTEDLTNLWTCIHNLLFYFCLYYL